MNFGRNSCDMSDEDKELDPDYQNAQMLAALHEKSKNTTTGRPPIYSEEEVDYVIDKLRRNKYNVRKTAEQTGVNGKTIKIWYNRKVMEHQLLEQQLEAAQVAEGRPIQELREEYEREVIIAKTALLKLIVKNLRRSKSSSMLVNALAKINESSHTTSPAKAALPAKEGSILAVLAQQATINNNSNNGPKDNRTGGDSEEPAG